MKEEVDGYERKLSNFDKLRVSGTRVIFETTDENGKIFSPASIDLGRPVVSRDVKNLITIFAMGSASKSRTAYRAFEIFMNAIQPTVIAGFEDPK